MPTIALIALPKDRPTARDGYPEAIQTVLNRRELGHLNVRHVEAWMRADPNRLDHLSPEGFDLAVREAAIKVLESSTEECEKLARVLGLVGPV